AGSDLTTDATLDVEDVLDEKEAMDKTYSEEATKSEIAKRTVTPSENGDEKSGNDGDNIDDLKNEESSPVNELLVETNSGDIEGFKQEVLGKTVYTFLGIPYASPPIGESRFKLAKILKPWRRPYKAKYWPPHCAQTISPLSGSPVHPRSILDEYSHIAEKFATAVGCNNENETLAADDPEEVLSCIKSQPTNTLKDATADVVAEYPLVSFMPSIGGLMFPVSAIESFAEPLDYYDEQKEIMIGVNKDEGSFFLHFAFPDRFRMSEAPAIKSKEETNLLLSEMVKSKLPLPEPIVNEAMRIFSDDATTNFTNNEEYVNYIRRIFGDNTIKCPVASFAKHFSGIQNKTVYFYQFEHRSAANKDADWVGVPTYEEVQFIFGLPLINQDEYSPADVELSKRMMNTWIHFAKTGEALPQLEKEWPKFELNDYEYMKIKADKAEIGADFGSQCLLFNHALNSGY
ncbi:acetylcholinesterase-like protein, partial [Dinothrombium tinctorium]